jgi:hypothetical protein
VALSTLDQGGGGVLTVETASGAIFDSIVFAEKEPRRWMAGSDFYRRSRDANGPEESTKSGELIHLAAVYRADNTITLYRNGRAYGSAWKGNAPMVVFDAKSRVLFGRRHTGGGRAVLAGEIEEARFYDRAIDAREIAASFKAGPATVAVSEKELTDALAAAERESRDAARAKLQDARKRLEKAAPGGKDPWNEALAEAGKNSASPLHAWATGMTSRKTDLSGSGRQEIGFGGYRLSYESGPGVSHLRSPGEFVVLPAGERIISGLLPVGIGTGALTRKHGGIAATARFQITTDFISIRACGSNAQCRLIVDGYPLGTNPIFPRAQLNHEEPRWVKMDVKYRKGSWAYLEFATAGDLTRSEKEDARSWFAVFGVEAHDADVPRAETAHHDELLAAAEGDLASRYRAVTEKAIRAWGDGSLTEPQRAWLDFFVRRGLLSNQLAALPKAAALVADFRRVENNVAIPRRAPGVLDADSYDAAFLPRGEHLKPGDSVPRGYLGVLGHGAFPNLGASSGRMQLAQALTAPANPLTARVMVNRIWLHLFGQGLVSTPDSFGKMGEPPTHPELLDFLAARLVEEGWSTKKMIRYLVLARAWRMSSEPAPAARERDPANALLSHARVRRLEAEGIRDTLLSLSGLLDTTMYGPGAGVKAPRRAVYLGVRRTALNPFLATFDAPKPFSTLGRRDSTNVPAQSLALLNDPFVAECAEKWADRLRELGDDERLALLFQEAFARPPSDIERMAARQYLLNGTAQTWRDLAHALINVKEFIYLR